MKKQVLHGFVKPALAGLLVLVLPVSALQAAQAGYATYFVPADQENMLVVFEDMAKGSVNNSPNPPFTEIETQPLRSIIGITSWADSVQVYVDHWEDGYEFDPDDPAGTSDEACAVLNLGDQLTLESPNVATTPAERNLADNWTFPAADCAPTSDCATPNTANGCYYDGRDKIFTVGGAITLTRAILPESVTDAGFTDDNPALVQAVAWEVYPVQPQLTAYVLPFGEDLFSKVDGGGNSGEAGNYAPFERVAALVQSTEDGTIVELDLDNDGTFDSFSPSRDTSAPTDCTTAHTLNAGAVLLVDRNSDGGGGCGATPDGGLDTGALIEGSGTLQVQYVIGDPTADYWEIRGFSAFPRGFWDDEYYAPVDEDGQGDSGGTDVYLHNPGATAITIDWQDNASSGSFSVGAGATESFVDAAGAMTIGSSTYFSSRGGEPFWGISTIDSTAPAGAEGVNYDWGYSLVPAYLLEDEYFIGFAPARIPPVSGDNDDGIYLAPAQDNVRIFVDYDADGTVDDTYDLDRLDTQYVTDASDGDMSGAQIFATARFIAAFGENAANTTPAEGLDLGYTTLPSADWFDLVLQVEKAVDPVTLNIGTGEITRYSITVSTAEFDIEDLRVVDELATGWAYCDSTTTCPGCDDPVTAGECPDPVVTFPDGSTSNDTPSTSGQDVTWDSTRWTGGPLDVAPNQEVTIVYYAYTTAGHADGSVTISPVSATGERNVGTPVVTQTFTATDKVFNLYTTSSLMIEKWSKTPGNCDSDSGNDVDVLSPGDSFCYRVKLTNTGNTVLTSLNLYDPIPEGATYSPGTTSVESGTCLGFAAGQVRDQFDTNDSYAGSNGTDNWDGDWTENDFGGAAGGDIEVVGNQLRFDTGTDGGEYAERSWTLPASPSTVTISFDFADTGLDGNDDFFVRYSIDGGAFIDLEALDGNSANQTYTNNVGWSPGNSTITLRIFAEDNVEGGEFAFFDNVDISYAASPGGAPTLSDPPNVLDATAACNLAVGASLAISFDVTVDDPFPSGQNELANVAEATSNEIPVPVTASVTDPVLLPSSETATVGDLVWLDDDGDGSKDIGEIGIANVEVTLKDRFGTPLQVTTTDANGRYRFTGVSPGTGYYVEVTGGLPGGLVQTTDARTDDRTDAFDLAAGQDYEDADLGYRPTAGTAIIGDRVWVDADADGSQDPGEPGLAGVTVQLLPDSDGDGIADDTAVDLVGGGLDLDGDGAITSSDSGVVVDNGGTPRAVINGRIDLDGDGSIESGGDDDGSVNLGGTSYTVDDGSLSGGSDPTPAITNYRTAVTVGNGLYSFTVAASGSEDYVVFVNETQTALTGYETTTQSVFSFLDVQDGSSLLTADVGVVQDTPGTTFAIRDRVWLDDGFSSGITADGLQNGGEAGIAGVTVDLLDASDNVIATTTTGADGDFVFSGVPAGVRYSWQVTDTGGVLNDYYATTSYAQAAVYQMPGPLTADVDHTPAPHFGYNYVRAIGDTVFNDLDGDGVQDPGEPGIGGVEVKLYSDAGTLGVIDGGDAVIATLTTDADGKYLFSGLTNSGTYLVSIESPPAGFAFTGGAPNNTLPDTDSGTPGQQNPAAVGAGGESDLSSDFPYQATVPAWTISGRVWEDDGSGGGTAEDGVQDPGEGGFENVAVDLYLAVEVIDGRLDVNDDGVVDGTDDGTFQGFTVIDGFLDMDGDGDLGVPDAGDDGAIAGFSIVDGRVDWDGSGSGIGDGGALPDVVYLTTTTDADGDYSFPNVAGGGADYLVIVSDDAGVLSGYDTTFERTESTTGPWNGVESILNLVADVTDVDYGYYAPPISATPITLASLDSWWTPDGLAVEWTTETETRNVGFHLYGRRSRETAWRRLTERLIPSRVIDSLRPQRYRTVLPGVAVETLLIEDWDTRGTTRRHGPFAVGRLHGFDAVANSVPIDWASIHVENALLEQRRSTPAKSAGLADVLLWVTETGVQRIAFDTLQAAGVDFGGAPIDELALTDNGAGHWRHVIDANVNGRFDSGDSIEFAGEVAPTLYSGRNAYRLWVDPSRAAVKAAASSTLDPRNAAPGVFPGTVTVEPQRAYSFGAPAGDPWYDEWLIAFGGSAALERTFDLPGYAGGDAILHLSLYGVTDWPGAADDHHQRVELSGAEMLDVWFDGHGDASQTIPLPAGLLTDTGNLLRLEAPGDTGYDFDVQALDGFRIDYARHTEADSGSWTAEVPPAAGKIEVTGFEGQAVAWKGRRRYVQGTGATGGSLFLRGKGGWLAADERAIHQPAFQADIPPAAEPPLARAVDYLIVSHPLFIDTQAMQDLEALQQTRGYTTAVVDVETLYAAYSDFEVDPLAIRKYLKRARPGFVLLVGGDSYDYHDYLGLASRSFIPTFYAATDELITFAPADSLYVDYRGDLLPQTSLGRLPARTEAELTQVVTKLWNVQVPSVAVLASGPSDRGRLFAQIGEGYAAQLPDGLPSIELYVDDLGLESANALLTDELNLGQALVSYVGHSSFRIWGLNLNHGILFSADEARALTNASPSLVTQWGCWNTYFVDPQQDTMANAFLFQDGGAAAVLGATALTDVEMLRDFGAVFFDQVGRRDTLGKALFKAHRAFVTSNPEMAGKLQGFALLGDPATPLR